MSARPGFVPDQEAGSAQVRALQGRVATLEARVAWLEDALTRMLGEPDAAMQQAAHCAPAAGAVPEIVPNPLLDRFLLRTQPMRSPFRVLPPAQAFAADPLRADNELPGAHASPLTAESAQAPQPLVLNLDEPAAGDAFTAAALAGSGAAAAALVAAPAVAAYATVPAASAEADDLHSKLLAQAQRQVEQHLRERTRGAVQPAAQAAPQSAAPSTVPASKPPVFSLDDGQEVQAAGAEIAPPAPAVPVPAPAPEAARAQGATGGAFSLGITAAFETLEDKIAMAADAELAVATRKKRPAGPGIALLPEMAATGRLAADRKLEVCCALEMLNPSILQQIMAIWHLPECAARVQRLVSDDQGTGGGRMGLDPAVREELILLGQLRAALSARQD